MKYYVLYVLVGSEPVGGGDFCCSGLFVCFAFVLCFACSHPRISMTIDGRCLVPISSPKTVKLFHTNSSQY